MCLQSWPRAGNEMRLYVIGQRSFTFCAVCSTPSSPEVVMAPPPDASEDEKLDELKYRLTETKISVVTDTQKANVQLTIFYLVLDGHSCFLQTLQCLLL